MKSIAIYCGANRGNNPIYEQTAIAVGQLFASNNITLVYGGGNIGLMGATANGALAHGGTVIGVCPHFLIAKEVGHEGLTELIAVESMHERKAKIESISDAFVALPGGLGTLDELFEILTWHQLLLHQKPIAVLNINGFWDPLLQQLDLMVKEGFLHPNNRQLCIEVNSVETLLPALQNFNMPQTTQNWWIKP